ncbi:MAG: zinc-dependent metalloprotease [Capnocytophaga sp.]|nr:zinc-dependent metalloprotease [Capnocytophaga sp.]
MKKLIIGILSFSCFSLAVSQEKTKEKEKPKEDKYKEITGGAVRTSGMLDIYTKKGDYYFVIPDSLAQRDFLIVNKISSVPANFNDAGINKGMNFQNVVVQFHINREQNKVYVMQYEPFVTVGAETAISSSVESNYAKSILEYFDIAAHTPDSTSVLIKVNKIYDGSSTNLINVFGMTGITASSPMKDFSYIEEVKNFPNNIVIKSLHTTNIPGAEEKNKLTVGVTSNLVLLPKTPMSPRFDDARIGYFSTPRWYFSDTQHELEKRKLITRWRLEPKDKEAYFRGELTEPVKPIVFHIDPATPPQWIPYIKSGIFDWQKAFEAAGFKNAIIAKEVAADDTDFDIDDVRYSAVTYAASDKANAMGPSVYDPRSGEILEADVIWWHNVLASVQSWMRVQTGIIDEKSRPNKFSDAHLGEAVRFVSSHEIGHTLGLKHNMGASYAYPVDSLRSKSFTGKNATAPSIMDYARFNYVAQPEDGITDITPKIGEYDIFAIAWGYRYFKEQNPHKEMVTLRRMLEEAQQNPNLRYLPQQDMRTAIDPRAQSEDLGDDAVKASNYGLANLKRIMPQIMEWTTQKGDDYLEAGKLWNAVIGQWYLYAYHVLTNVGGVYINTTTMGDGLKSYEFVPKEKQREAVNYLIDNVAEYPEWLFGNAIQQYVYPVKDSPNGYNEYSPFASYKNMQSYVFWDILTNERLDRMTANELENGAKAYTALEMLNDLYRGIFANTLKNKPLTIEERATQKAFVDALIIAADRAEISKEKKSLDESKNFASTPIFSGPKRISEAVSLKRGILLKIQKELKSKKNTKDTETRYHYDDILLRIRYALDEK